MPTYVILNKLSHYCPENHRHLIPFNIGTMCGTIQGKTEELPVHLGMTPKETPLPIVYFKMLFHRFLFKGFLKAKVQTYSQTAKIFML